MDIQQVVARWKAEELAVRARLSTPGIAPHEKIAGRTGMEMFDAIFAGELPPAPIGDTLDFVAIHIEAGTAVFEAHGHRAHRNQ